MNRGGPPPPPGPRRERRWQTSQERARVAAELIEEAESLTQTGAIASPTDVTRDNQPPPFGMVHPDDDIDIEIQRPKDAARKHLWQESRLLVRDLIFALMVLALVMVFIIQPVKVEGTSMLPYLHDGERIFVNKLVYYDDYRWAPKI